MLTGTAHATRVSLDLGPFLEQEEVSLRIDAISVHKLFRTSLNRERFEDYLTTVGPDYSLTIRERGTVGEIVGILRSLDLRKPDPHAVFDLRYKLTFFANKEPVSTVYVGGFGEVLLPPDFELVEPKRRSWLRDTWNALEADVLLDRRR